MTGKAAGCLSTPLRRIGYRDPEAGEVAAIYKARWQIELFFKWVKQHLKIKSFLGTTANAVMTQVWVALCVYLLVAYVKFLLRPPRGIMTEQHAGLTCTWPMGSPWSSCSLPC